MRESVTVFASATIAVAGLLVFETPADAGFQRSRAADFQVNAYTTGAQSRPRVHTLTGGGFVVAWQGPKPGEFDNVNAQVLDASGAPVGSEFVVNTYTTSTQYRAEIASEGSGDFMITWRGRVQNGVDFGVYGQRFDATATPLGSEFAINTSTSRDQLFHQIEGIPGVGYIVVWSSRPSPTPAGSVFSLLAQRLDPAGVAIGPEIVVSADTGLALAVPAIGVDAAGNTMIAWREFGPAFTDSEIFASIYSPSGALLAGPVSVGSFTDALVDVHAVSSTAAGEFLVAWSIEETSGTATGFFDVRTGYLQAIDITGTVTGPLVTLNEDPDDQVTTIRLMPIPAGKYTAVYGRTKLGTVGDLFARELDADGSPLAPSFLVNDHLPGLTYLPAVAPMAGGSFAVTWTEALSVAAPDRRTSRDGDAAGVFGNIVCADTDPSCDLCPGFDDTIDNDADGIPDGCDLCVNIAGAQDMSIKAKLSVRSKDTDVIAKSNKVTLRGEAIVAGGFAGLDPIGKGMRLRIESAHGGAISDVVLPPGALGGSGSAGWQSKGSKYKFIDKTGNPTDGFSRVTITDRSKKSPGQIKLNIKGRGGLYPAGPMFSPVRAVVVFGDEVEAAAGQCAETVFTAADCNADTVAIKCK